MPGRALTAEDRCGGRWRFKFFDSGDRLELRDDKDLGNRQRARDTSAALDIVREDLDAAAQVFTRAANRESSRPRSQSIKDALWEVFGDGCRDGAFAESSNRSTKDLAGGLESKPRTHHAIYLFAPSKCLQRKTGHTEKQGAEGHGSGATLDDAKRLHQAFKKYLITLQVHTMLTLPHARARPLHRHIDFGVCLGSA